MLEGHLAYFISDVVDNLDISEIEKEYEKELRGYPPYHPRMMLKVLIYGYCTRSTFLAETREEDPRGNSLSHAGGGQHA